MQSPALSDRVPVTCGKLKAVFFPDSLQAEVEVNGQVRRVTANELERMSGLGYRKKWRNSVRVKVDHLQTISIGAWLFQRAQTYTKGTTVTLEGNKEAPESLTKSVESPPKLKCEKISILDRMKDALASCKLTTGPSDPDAATPSRLRSALSNKQQTIIDYRKMTDSEIQDHLKTASMNGSLYKERKIAYRKKTKDSERSKSPEMKFETPDPAVVKSIGRKRRREGFLNISYRPNPTTCEMEDDDALLFQLLDAAEPFSFHGIQLSLAELYDKVEDLGGYETVVSGENWAAVAEQLQLPVGQSSVDTDIVDDVEMLYMEHLLSLNDFMNRDEDSSTTLRQRFKQRKENGSLKKHESSK